jgi:hypothetical protein
MPRPVVYNDGMIAKAHPRPDDNSEVLSIEEIRARYDGQWVLVVEPHANELCEVLSGKVVFHSKDRNAVWDAAAPYTDEVAVFYVGDPPPGMIYAMNIYFGSQRGWNNAFS